MADKAAHVTMLQRSPTYIVTVPAEDKIANWIRDRVPGKLGHSLARWKAILLGIFFYTLARKRPAATKQRIVEMVRQALGPDYDVEKHFSPRYNPWDQRVCLVPDSDLFKAITAGKVSVVTDQIETFTETGITLRSGEELQADIIVTATGLNMKLMSGVQLVVDGVPTLLSKTLNYKGMMFSDIPNLASAIGYTNASWTLKSELTSEYVCRLLNYMDQHGYVQCTPRKQGVALSEEPIINFNSGYILRALESLPHQGSQRPWKLYQNYVLDLFTLRYGKIDDGTMEFKRRERRPVVQPQGGQAWRAS